MKGEARTYYVIAFAIAVVTLIVSVVEDEPTLLVSSAMALFLFSLILFNSFSKGKNMKRIFPLFTALCLGISAVAAIFIYSPEHLYTEASTNFILYAMQTSAYLGVALLILISLYAYFDLRLDRLLTSMCIIFFEMAVSVVGLFGVRVLKAAALEAAGTDMMTFVLIAAQYSTGLVIAFIAGFASFFLLRKKKIRLMTEKIVLEEVK